MAAKTMVMTAPIRTASRAVKAKPAPFTLVGRQYTTAREAFTKPETPPPRRTPHSHAAFTFALRSFIREAISLGDKIRGVVDTMSQHGIREQYKINTDGGLDIYQGGMRLARLPASYLRDRCPCPQCVSPSSGNKSFSTGEIPTGIQCSTVSVTRDGSLRIHWKMDIPRAAQAEHFTTFPATGPNSLATMMKEMPAPFAPLGRPMSSSPIKIQRWHRKTITQFLRRMDYADFVAGGFEFQHALMDLCRYGIIFLENVPQNETAVADIALKFGAIKETFYGRTWDVVSKPDAENVAYTSSYLGLHSDMLYLESPPRIQLLHCLENSCSGGESMFSDALHASFVLASQNYGEFRTLCEVKVPYHYSANGFLYRQERPVLVLRKPTDLLPAELWWSPPFQAPFHRHDLHPRNRDLWARWHKAAGRFQTILEKGTNVFNHMLRPGECVIFDNRRVLHGRHAFNADSGRRWLKGAYVANDDFTSAVNAAASSSDFREYLKKAGPETLQQIEEVNKW